MPRLYAYGIAAVALLLTGFLSGWTVQGWRAEAAKNAAIESARAAEKAAQQNVIDSYKAEIKAARESSSGHQAELIRLRNAALLEPVPTVRVCKPPRSAPADLPRARDATSGSSHPAEGRGVLPPAVESHSRDIGPELAALADEADRCSAQLRGLIDWIGRTR